MPVFPHITDLCQVYIIHILVDSAHSLEKL